MRRIFLLTLHVAVLAACGAQGPAAPAIDEEKIANRAAEIVLQRLQTLRGQGLVTGAAWPVAADPSFADRTGVPVDGRPARGAEDALVTIVEFADFECPFSSRVRVTLDQLLREHPGEIRLVFRQNPLISHPHAHEAAEAALEARAQGGDDAFWAMHDLLFDHQDALERSDLVEHARRLGLDVERFERALDSDAHAGEIREDVALAERIGARGTPYFYINGRRVAGAQPFEAFDAMVRDEIRMAGVAMEAGVLRAELYERLVAVAPDEEPDEPPPSELPARPIPDPNAVYRVPLQHEPQRGPDDALVTVVMVGDFQCPFCGRVRETLDRLLDEYGSDLRLVWMNNPLPFHENAPAAHQAALEAYDQGGDRAFWRMHDLLFDNQRDLSRDRIVGFARMLGLDARAVRRAIDTREHQATIDRHQELAQSLGATGTPSFFINGRNLRGAQPYERFHELVEEELARARRVLAEGVPRDRLYETLIADGATSPQTIPGDEPARGPELERFTIPVPTDAPRRGATSPALVIQEFSDFLNNAAIAAERLRRATGERVAVLDVDVHHGNGTQGIFYGRDDVLTVSIHADPSDFFPFYAGYADERGEGAGLGHNRNLPLPHGSGDAAFLRALEEALGIVGGSGARALVVALGLDASEEDPIGALRVTTDGFARAARAIASAGLPTVLVQEGGYPCPALARNLVAFLGAFESERG